MIEAQKIACSNDAAFVMSFVAQTNGASSLSSGDYPIDQTRVIDLATTTFREGLEFWPVVKAVLGKTQAADEHIVYKNNGQTATYQVTGTTFNYEIKLVGRPSEATLPDFPAGIPLNRYPFKNWAGAIKTPDLWTCEPRTAQDVVDICNWAKEHGFLVRPRGIMHTWSPLTVTNQVSADKVILVDTTKNLCQMTMALAQDGQPPQVRVGTGATMGDLLAYLETQPGGKGAAPGYSFPHTPGPGNLTVGGVLAINAHGTAVPTPPLDMMLSSYGSMSNHILEFTAVVTDPQTATPDQYTLRTFRRDEADTKAFLTHLGRAFLVEVVLEVVDNYNLRCRSYTNLPTTTLFAPCDPSAPPPTNSFGDFLEQFGRIEVIWYPFTDKPWLHLWNVAPEKPAESRRVDSPYNYPFADHLDPTVEKLLNQAFGSGELAGFTPQFGELMYRSTVNGLDGKDFLGIESYAPSRDIWGPSKNTLLYIQDSTLRVTANGYAIQMRKRDVQQAVHDFTTQYRTMLARYQQDGKYPVNSAVEIRVTGLDNPQQVGGAPDEQVASPVISSLTQDETSIKNGWDVALWVDVLTFPNTPHSNEFYQELEEWILQRFTGAVGRVLPEWSKGWAYTSDGPWTNEQFMASIRQSFSNGRNANDNWNWEVATLQKYDRHGLFMNRFLTKLFTVFPSTGE